MFSVTLQDNWWWNSTTLVTVLSLHLHLHLPPHRRKVARWDQDHPHLCVPRHTLQAQGHPIIIDLLSTLPSKPSKIIKFKHNEKGSRRSSGSSPTRHTTRVCVSCHSSDSPCWRPSWSPRKQDQLCNSCGLRYKKTHTRCLNDLCRKIPTKGEINIMKSNGIDKEFVPERNCEIEGYRCLFCNYITETVENWYMDNWISFN